MTAPDSSSLFCGVCSGAFATPQGRAGHQSHSQDPAHRAAYEARKAAEKSVASRRPTVQNRALGQPVRKNENRGPARESPSPAVENKPALAQQARENLRENHQIQPTRLAAIEQAEPLALEAGETTRLLPATVPLRPDLGPRLYPHAATEPGSPAAPTPASPAAPASASPSAHTYTAADFFTALAATPPRAGLARWERWVLGIGVLAGLTLTFMWPLIKERRARIAAEHRSQAHARVATPTPLPHPAAAPVRSMGFPWPPAALNGGVRVPASDRPWWCL